MSAQRNWKTKDAHLFVWYDYQSSRQINTVSSFVFEFNWFTPRRKPMMKNEDQIILLENTIVHASLVIRWNIF